MIRVSKPREIIDRKKVVIRLDDILGWSGYSPDSQREIFDIYREALEHGRAEVRRRFEADEQSGRNTIKAGAYLIDQLVRIVYDVAAEHIYPAGIETADDVMSVIATGGYGRAEMAPHSDIDLMFLLPYKLTPRAEQVVEYVLYTLWDLGLKVGHATRSADEVVRLAKEDITIRTSLLESRLITGNAELFDTFKVMFQKDVVKGTGMAYVEAKLAERDDRHARMGDTRYVLEPNIKDGKGGLRDLQTLMWIAKYLYGIESIDDLKLKGVLTADDARRFEKAQDFLWTVRCHLHYLAERPEERLTFNVQADIGKRMGYTDHAGLSGVERFMKHYFLIAKDVGDLTRIICAALEEQHKTKRRKFRLPRFGKGGPKIDGFNIDGDRLTVADDNIFETDPKKLLELFWQAQKHGLDIHPSALRLVTKNLKRITKKLQNDPVANEIFINILTGKDPDKTLMRMNEAGVFGKFVPDFGRVVAQMQYDMYHVYTVDEHTIRAIGVLHGIDTNRLTDDHPLACSVIGEVQSKRVLYLSVLLHDIAKGRGGDHSELGADIALKLGPRMGLSEWETETVSWLVRYHLLMSNTAFKRDIDDTKTVADFIEIVQSPERLRLLLILTIADIRAVGPNVWNAWKAGLLRELYWQAREAMSGETLQERLSKRADRVKHKLSEALLGSNKGWTPEAVEEHFELARDNYWLTFSPEVLLRHAELVRTAMVKKQNLYIELNADEAHDATEVVVYTVDHPGLFAKVAGALSLGGVNIVDAKIVTMNNGMALDTFWVQDAQSEAISGTARVGRIQNRIERALSGEASPAYELKAARANAMPSRTSVFKVPPRVLIDNKASRTYTVIEVNGRDRLGFLHDITNALTNAGLQIASAHISTYGERVVDVFYVKDIFGLKMEQQSKIKSVRERLLTAIEGPVAASSPKAAE
ncbi:MAG: [protein-PII] uridylyltransferase [Rhodospirillales bacterium]|nr:[protein-PII] uridylyltransferase [Rhodospirillales bacterium]